jgi:hypothetical protein
MGTGVPRGSPLCLFVFITLWFYPGRRRCPRQPHIANKEGRSYAVTKSVVEIDAATWRKEECSRGCASDADRAAGTTETDRRAKELGAAMLNAARPYMDVKLDKDGYPVAVTPRDFFAFVRQCDVGPIPGPWGPLVSGEQS